MLLVAQSSAALSEGSATLRVSFVALSLFIAVMFTAGVWRSATRSGLARAVARRHATIAGVGAAVWLSVTGAAAARGLLHFSAPPTMLVVFPLVIAAAIAIALSPAGRRLALGLPVAALVGFQGFRVVVELLLHRAYTEGLMPVQMSYAGRNFDIVTGITAFAVALWLTRDHASARVVFAWNTLGVGLLLNILIVALLSAPTPVRVFMNEPANVWITRAPWIWLPTVMVLAAIMGHALVYRRLWIERTAADRLPASPSVTGVLRPRT